MSRIRGFFFSECIFQAQFWATNEMGYPQKSIFIASILYIYVKWMRPLVASEDLH